LRWRTCKPPLQVQASPIKEAVISFIGESPSGLGKLALKSGNASAIFGVSQQQIALLTGKLGAQRVIFPSAATC